jgi:phosphotriesterase-related protein
MIDETMDFGLEPGESFEPEVEEEPFDLSRPYVMTALGPVDPADLGLTLHHEHIIANPPGDDVDLVINDPHRALTELEAFEQVGGRTIVDMTTADYGRDVEAIAWIAERSPVHIVLATGHHKHQYAAPYLGDRSADQIAAISIRELTEEIGATGISPGVIKAGTSLNIITPVEERVLRAAARAHLATGAPISTHTEQGTMALEQIALLQAEGVDPARVIIGHQDRWLEEAHLQEVLGTGAFVSFDQISKAHFGSDRDRAAMVARLVEAGFVDHLLLSGDLARKSAQPAYGGSPGWTYLVDTFPLMLMDAGLSAPTIRQLFFDNPARALTICR